jgi:hypothetical protein
MNRLFLTMMAILTLSGCVSDGVRAQRETSEAAKSLITPEMIKECSDRLLERAPKLTITGNFYLSPTVAGRVGDMHMWPDGTNANLVAMVARTEEKTVFGGEVKSLGGCSYRLQDGKLTFRAVHLPGSFGRVIFLNDPG